MTEHAKSQGHIAFVRRSSGGTWEYWTRCGEIWRMDASAPVMPDGYRCGRWYGAHRLSTIQNLRTIALDEGTLV